MARTLAVRFAKARGLDYDEMISVANVAVAEASQRWDGNRPLKHFVYRRIMGALADHLRAETHFDRKNKVPRVRLDTTLDDNPELSEGLTPVWRVFPDLETYMEAQVEMRCLDWLTARERFVVRMLHFEGRTNAEVGRVLGVGESRVSQIHAEALRRLREVLS